MIDLIRKVLSGDADECLILTPPQGEHDWNLPEGALHFLDRAFPESVDRRSLPEIGPQYLKEVQGLVQEEETDQLYVVPPFLRLRQLPEDIEDALTGRFADSRNVDLSGLTLVAILNALPRDARVAFTLPTNFFTIRGSESLRRKSLEEGHPELIIHPRSQPFGDAVDSAVQVQTIVYAGAQPESDETPVTRFFRVPSQDDAGWEEIVDDFERLLHQGGGETAFGYVVRHRLDPADPWTYESFDPSLQREIAQVEEIGKVRPLGDLFDSFIGLRAPDREKLKGEQYEGQIPVIEDRDIRLDGSIESEDTRLRIKREDVDREELYLRAGDLCLRQGKREGDRVVVGRVKQEMGPMIAGPFTTLLRPKDEISDQGILVVSQYLRTDIAAKYIDAKGDWRRAVSFDLLEKLPVPKADESLQRALRGLTEAADRFDEWKEEAQESAQSLFDFPSAEDGRMHVLTTGRRTRQRQEAAEQVDELSNRVQTQFPHPIAYRWRTVAASRPNLQGYRNVLGCAEVALCYLALLAIKMAQILGKRVGYVEEMGNRIVEQGRGVNLGDWIAILREVRESNAFLDLPDTTPFYDVMHFMPEGSNPDNAVTRLKSRRDDHSHEWKPQGSKPSEEEFREAKADLLELLSAAEFITEYPLRYVRRTEIDTLDDTVTYRYQDVMGDHPLVPTEEDTIEKRPLEADSLYLVDRSGGLHLLRPLLNRQRCPECGAWSTFHLDEYEGGDTCRLKSMERSHSKEEDLYPAFQKVGFLP